LIELRKASQCFDTYQRVYRFFGKRVLKKFGKEDKLEAQSSVNGQKRREEEREEER